MSRGRGRDSSVWLRGALLGLMVIVPGARPDPITGTAVSSPNWEILVTDFGYADFALDRRPGFVGREYLSGEWATAVGYVTPDGPAGPRWLQPLWLYPDWTSNSDFGVEQPVEPPGRNTPTNQWGFPVLRSVVTNAHLRVVLTYEMIDTGMGIAAGIVPRTQSRPPGFLRTDRYVFRQTCSVTNRSASLLRQVRLFQFVHGLESRCAAFDDRDYGGPLGEFHYDLTLQGRSMARDSRTGETVWLHDVLTLHVDHPPAAWECGYFGRWNVDSHITGKPPVGVHWSVETNGLSGLDWFMPPEGRYVSGALALDLGDLAPGEGVSRTFLLSVATWKVQLLPVRVLAVRWESPGNLVLAVASTNAAAGRLGLATTPVLGLNGASGWRPVWRTACETDPGAPDCYHFVLPVEPAQGAAFYRVETWLPP